MSNFFPRRSRRSAAVLVAGLAAATLTPVLRALPVQAAPSTCAALNIAGDDPNLTGDQWGFHEGYYSQLRSELTNASQFGSSGTVGASFHIGQPIGDVATGLASAHVLDQADVFFSGATYDPAPDPDRTNYTTAEKTAILNFVLSGGAAVITTNKADFADGASIFGFAAKVPNAFYDPAIPPYTSHKAPSDAVMSTAGGVDTTFRNGPFGAVGGVALWHTVTGFSSVPAGWTTAATINVTGQTDSSNNLPNLPVMAYIPAGGLGAGSGPVVVVSDLDIFSNAYNVSAPSPSAAHSMLPDNRKLALNTFAWIANQMCSMNSIPASSGAYTAITPVRWRDTRTVGGAVAANNVLTLQMTNTPVGGVTIPGSATGVVLNLTAVNQVGDGWITAYPCGAVPNSSSVNFQLGRVHSTRVVAAVSVSGQVCLQPSVTTDIVVDVDGYYTSAGHYVAATPYRALDTRSAVGIGTSTRPAAGQTVQLQVTGVGTINVPSNAGAVVMNVQVTGSDPGPGSWVTIWPCGSTEPLASSLNYTGGQTIGNLVTAKVDGTGKVCLKSPAATHLVADLVGYYPFTSNFVSLNPTRVMDTRDGTGGVRSKPVAQQWVAIDISGSNGVPANASAAVFNLTVTSPESPGWVTVWPCGETMPTTSSINYVAGDTKANLVYSKVGTRGRVCLASQAPVHLVLDVVGYHV